jgi:pimeloyl-ACP methyl ester carboxylesterase
MRGHGGSGTKGHIAYVGQLEDDLEDFVNSVKPYKPATLVGFSSGGGFALRFAGSTRQKLFSSYLLLSPFISQEAPTYRPSSGGWVSVGLPRFVAITLLNAIGIRAFNDLPVTKFALNEEAKAILTPEYSFALAQNFRPQRDYRANIRAVNQPLRVVAGQDDEVFYAEHFAEVFRAEGKDVPVTLIPGIGHIPLTLEHDAVQPAVAAVRSMNEPGGSNRLL